MGEVLLFLIGVCFVVILASGATIIASLAYKEVKKILKN